MTPDQIKAIRERYQLSAAGLSQAMGLGADGRHIRYLESGQREPNGPMVRILEMMEAGEYPARYIPAPARRGRPPKVQ